MYKGAVLLALVWLMAIACNAKQYSQRPITPHRGVVFTHSYTNITNKYHFQYPDGYELKSADDAGNERPATNKSPEIHINKGTEQYYIFRMAIIPLNTLSESAIKTRFSNLIDPQDIHVTSAQIGGIAAYQVSFDSRVHGVVSDFYFVQKPGQGILEITVLRNNDVAQQIFKSVSFTK